MGNRLEPFPSNSARPRGQIVQFCLFFVYFILASISLYDNRSSNSAATKYKLSLVALGPHYTMYPGVSKQCATLIWANDFDVQSLDVEGYGN